MGQIYVTGAYSGSFAFRDHTFEHAAQERVFLCTFSSKGILDSSTVLASEMIERPVGLEIVSDGSVLLLCQNELAQKLNAGRLVKLDYQLTPTTEITFEGTEVSMSDLSVFGEEVYLSGHYQGDFLVDQNKYFGKLQEGGFLLKFSTALEIDWARQFEFFGGRFACRCFHGCYWRSLLCLGV